VLAPDGAWGRHRDRSRRHAARRDPRSTPSRP